MMSNHISLALNNKAAYQFNSEILGECITIEESNAYHATMCQPRDIKILSKIDPKLQRKVIEEIVCDIRQSFGQAPVGHKKSWLTK